MESNLVAAFLLSTTPVNTLNDVTTVTMDTYCINTASLYEMIKKYEEKPMLTAISVRMVRDKEVPLATVLYVNADTKSWTLVEKVRDDYYCVIGMGDNIKPYTN